MRTPLVLALSVAVASCLPFPGPIEPEQPPPVALKLLRSGRDAVWNAAVAELEERGYEIDSAAREDGTIEARQLDRVRTMRQAEEIRREVARIADLEAARRRGLTVISELHVQPKLEIADAGERATRLWVTCRIRVIDRSQGMVLAPGIVHVIPQSFELPSKGVVERELLRRIGHRLFLGEEMLYYMGELGRD